MTIDTIKHLGAEFHRAADSLADTLARLDNARLERLQFLCRCSKDGTARLAAIKEEVRTLPEQIAKWDAEAARLESQTAEDLLRQALEPVQEEKPEPYRVGLPPERLRKVWAEWKDEEGDILKFSHDGQEFDWTRLSGEQFSPEDAQWAPVTELDSAERYRPHGATWARVEAMADEAEKPKCPACGKQPDRDALPLSPGEYVSCEVCEHYLRVGDGAVLSIVRPVENCGRVAADGTREHPNAQAPTLLDLTKLPPGTVCEAVATVFSENLSLQTPTGTRFVIKEHASDGDALVESLDARQMWVRRLQPARVVKEGEEQ